MPDVHLSQMFFDRAKRIPSACAIKYRHRGAPFAELSFKKAAERIRHIAAGILTAPGGLEPQTSVSLYSYTRVEWVLCDYAILSLGGRTVPIYSSLLAPEVGYIHQDTGAQIAFVENKEALEKIRSIKKGFTFFEVDYPPEKIAVRHIIVFDPDGIEPADDWESLEALEARGKKALEGKDSAEAKELDERQKVIQRKDVATYVYTSGTTGPPKGVIQTHDNHLSILENSEDTKMFAGDTQQTGSFLFLPLAHSFGRLIEYGASFFEAPLLLSSPETLVEDLPAVRPGFFPAAPRVFEKIYSKIMSGVADANPRRQKIFGWAMGVGERVLDLEEHQQPLPFGLKLQHRIADKLVFSKIRARLGLDRAEILLSGSAPLSREVQRFFGAIGLIIFEAYGLTETTPGLTANRPDRWKMGTVGPALHGVELKIADDGEILAKGPNVTSGYLNRPDANEDAFDDEGWFHTGDIGVIDKEGFVKITDRKKDLIKTSGGKYVAPQKIEGLLKNKPLVFEAAVIGDGRPYCVALLALDDEELEAWGKRTGNDVSPNSEAVAAELQSYLDDVNSGLASFETIKYYRLIDEAPSVDNGLLTGSFKLKRRVVAKRYESLIAEMFGPEASQGRAA